MNKLSKLFLLSAGFGILFAHTTMAGPFERFRERLAELRRQSTPPTAPTAPAAPAAPAAPTAPTAPTAPAAPAAPAAPQVRYDVTFNNTVWTGVMTLSSKSITNYKGSKKQDYEVSKPTLSGKVELWFPTETSWFLLADISQLKGEGTIDKDEFILVDEDCRDWCELIGSGPQGTTEEISEGGIIIQAAVLEGYDGEGTLNKNEKTFTGSRGKNAHPDQLILCSGTYNFSGPQNNPTMTITGTANIKDDKPNGVRIDGPVAIQGSLSKASGRTVSGDKNKVGGFQDKDWFGWSLLKP